MTNRMLLDQVLDALALPGALGAALEVQGAGRLPARYPVTDLACATLGAAALAVAHWVDAAQPAHVVLDRALASWWFGYTLRPIGWELPHVRAAMTGDYRARDGWIRIHANAPHHRQLAQEVLGVAPNATHDETAACVRHWNAFDLEEALVDAGGCAATLRTPAAWARHPQGHAVAREPLVCHRAAAASAARLPGRVDALRPLTGIHVLDLTRVLAGPVATRFLAAYGAHVLRLDAPDWAEPGMVPEVTVGKRCAAIDLRTPEGLYLFRKLLAQADVLVHGLRPGALDRLGLDTATRQALRPGLVDVSLAAWGWSGPWRARRGFDSLVQMGTGIAWPTTTDALPDPLPVQALDQATGYLMAACAIRGLTQRRASGRGSIWRVSLARTAALLASAQPPAAKGAVLAKTPPVEAFAPEPERTAWGPACRLRPPCTVGAARWAWARGAVALRGDNPEFG